MFNISRVLLVKASIIGNTAAQEIGTEFWPCFWIFNTLMRLITCRQGFPFLACSSQITENCNIENILLSFRKSTHALLNFSRNFYFLRAHRSLITVRLFIKSCNSCYEEITSCRRIRSNTHYCLTRWNSWK